MLNALVSFILLRQNIMTKKKKLSILEGKVLFHFTVLRSHCLIKGSQGRNTVYWFVLLACSLVEKQTNPRLSRGPMKGQREQ